MAVPNTFAAATSAIPLANLDANFAYYDAAYSITSTAISFTGAVTLSTGTANGVPYLNASKVLTSGSVLTFDGTILSSTRFAGALNGTVGATTANTGAFTTLTTSSTVTLNGGTANGVAYLNGSKVLTSGTALTYNGSDTLNLSTTNPSLRLTGDVNSYYTAIYAYAGGYGANKGYFLDSYNGMRIMSSGDIQFCPNGTTLSNGSEQMRLTSTGLGIGTSSFSGYRLNVVAAFSSGLGGAYIEAGEFNKSALILNHTNASVSANLFQVQKSGTGVMTLDSSGNLGLGVTPSAWSLGKALEVGAAGNGLWAVAAADLYLVSNVIYSSSLFKYASSNRASYYEQNVGTHVWKISTDATPTAGNTITFTQAMTLDASGNLGIGTSSPAYKLDVRGAVAGGNGTITGVISYSTRVEIGAASNHNLGLITNNTTQAVLDTSGNLGLGVTPSAWTAGYKVLQVGPDATGASYIGSGYSAQITVNAYNTASTWTRGGNTYAPAKYSLFNGTHVWSTAAAAGTTIAWTETMTLDASGNLLVGTTNQVSGSILSLVGGSGKNGAGIQVASGQTGVIYTNTGAYNYNAETFNYNGSQVGYIQVQSALTLYATTSDYRLKTVVGAVSGQGARIDALKPIEYTWKSNGSSTRGFLAHQFQEIYAGSVNGTKDAVDAEGKPVYQAMQAATSEVIADLVAEIQDLRKRLAAAGI